VILPTTESESLAYTIRRRVNDRTRSRQPHVEMMTTPDRSRRGHEEIRRGTGQCALRHPAAGLAVVAAYPNSDHRRGSLQRDSNAGPTLRYEVLGWHHAERVHASGKRCIWAFWHRIIIPIVWWHRNHGVVVMNTTAFDGQWTRKVIEWLGFGTAQGSSSRGGLRGLAVMARRLDEGVDCAFTIDGPRGPRYVAKPGPLLLARKTGCPILVFHIGVNRGKTFEKTWDHFLLPAPFARAVILFAPPIYVPTDASAEVMEAKHAETQRELERVRDIAESWFFLSDAEREKHRAEFSR